MLRAFLQGALAQRALEIAVGGKFTLSAILEATVLAGAQPRLLRGRRSSFGGKEAVRRQLGVCEEGKSNFPRWRYPIHNVCIYVYTV